MRSKQVTEKERELGVQAMPLWFSTSVPSSLSSKQHCRTLLSLEDGCSHWLQDSLLLLSSQNCLWKCFWSRGNSSKDFAPFLLYVPLDNFVLCPGVCLFLAVLHFAPSVSITQLDVCWYNVPDLSQVDFQTTSRFQYGAPLKQTGSVISPRVLQGSW